MKKILLALFSVGGAFWGYKEFHLSDDKFLYAGTVEATKVTLSSKLMTDIIALPVEEGDEVKKDEIVAKLNNDIYQVASKQLNNDYERSLKLLHNGHTSVEQHDRIEVAKRNNDLHIQWCDIKSPINGTVIAKFKEKGELVSPGTNIISLADMDNVWAYFYVEHDLIYKIKIGGSVSCTLLENPGMKIVGTVVKINEEAEFTPKNVQTREERTRLVYGVKVRFNNKNRLLKAGMVLETSFE
ncbi:MAG: efflux RND transporter periplasmic adaptor subunit [Holosporaceae bacterium]|jgi:HlyD family secretion protein|nr:efflux RND transporter periplasmic adaptor subunit [Holosporaceae bacterium]